MEKSKKKGLAPPRYNEAFTSGAVRLVTEQGRPSTEVVKELGICVDTLRNWLKAAGAQPGQADRQNREARRMRELEAELRTLRRQLSEKDEVIDVLKLHARWRAAKMSKIKICLIISAKARG